MSKAVQLHIPEPCHENWHNMTPQNQGRFCGSCQKIVVDFSTMSDKEILDYIASASTHLCGRFSNDQLNREIKVTENKRRFSWAYIWNVLLATFLVTESYAQGTPATKGKPVIKNNPVKPQKPVAPPNILPTMGTIAVVEPDELPPPPKEISGVVRDKITHEYLRGASVYLIDKSRITMSDSLGNFHLPVNNADSVILTITYIGYEAQTLVLNSKTAWQNITIELDRVSFSDVIFVGGITVNHKIKRKEKIKRTVNSWMPAAFKKDISVYPNPVVRGNAIQANVSLKQTGSYKLELIDGHGQVVEVQELVMTTREQPVTIPTQTGWSAGIYWIRITATKVKNVYQAKVSIQ